jgi:hypothetical protein
MSDPVVKKVIIKKEDLPAFDGVSQNYLVRYRIVSEDKNRTSHWSPYYSIGVEDVTEEEELECSVSINDRVVNMVWAGPENQIVVSYDIYFKFGSDDWKYIGTTLVNQFSSLIPASVSTISVSLHRSTYPKTYSSRNAYFTSDPITAITV